MKPIQFLASFFNVTLKTPSYIELSIAILSWSVVTTLMLLLVPGIEGSKTYALSFAIFAGAFLHACGANVRHNLEHLAFVLFASVAFGGIGHLAHQAVFG